MPLPLCALGLVVILAGRPRKSILRCVAAVAGSVVLAVPSLAHAERGALSLDVGSGAALVSVRAPYAEGAPSQLGTTVITSLGFRYAVADAFELGAASFYEPPTTFTYPAAQVLSPAGSLAGILSARTQQLSFVVRGRFVHGFAWRLVAGADVGLAIRSFTDLAHYHVTDSSNAARTYGLPLHDTSQKTFMVGPSVGVEWSGDQFTIGVAPRLQLYAGSMPTWSVALPISLSWTWFL